MTSSQTVLRGPQDPAGRPQHPGGQHPAGGNVPGRRAGGGRHRAPGMWHRLLAKPAGRHNR